MPYQEEGKIKQNAGILLERVNQYSQEAAQGSFEGALSLLRQ